MTRSPLYLPLCLCTVVLLAGCAGSKEARAPHPLAGSWAYTIDTPQGLFTGSLIFTETGDGLAGLITSSESAPGEGLPLEELSFEEGTVSFTYDSGQYGMMDVVLTLDGDALDGDMEVRDYQTTVPFTATRTTG